MIKRAQKKYLLRGLVAARSHILISGPPNIGKTTIALELLQDHTTFDGVFAYVNCNEIATSSKLYSDIITELSIKINRPKILAVSIADTQRGLDVLEFVDSIAKVYKYQPNIYVILDDVEQLKYTSMMDSLVVLATTRKVSLLLISIQPALELLNSIKQETPRLILQSKLTTVEIPHWTRSELIEMIKSEPPLLWKDVYPRFVNNVVGLMYGVNTNDLRVIKNFCQENYGQYIKGLIEHLRELYKKQYKSDQELSNEELEQYDITNANTTVALERFLSIYKDKLQQKRMPLDALKVDKSVTYKMIVMITSAFIAAYTRPSDDKKNFVKYQEKKLRQTKEHEPHTSKPFTMERMIQIYRSLYDIIDQDKNRSNSLTPLNNSNLCDIQRLEDLGLVKIISGDGVDTLTKYRISELLTKEYVQRLCEQVDFDLNHIHGVGID